MLYEDTSDKFAVKVADTINDAIKLREVGLEFHPAIEGNKLFRKRKLRVADLSKKEVLYRNRCIHNIGNLHERK